jgi:hypothetical protein
MDVGGLITVRSVLGPSATVRMFKNQQPGWPRRDANLVRHRRMIDMREDGHALRPHFGSQFVQRFHRDATGDTRLSWPRRVDVSAYRHGLPAFSQFLTCVGANRLGQTPAIGRFWAIERNE